MAVFLHCSPGVRVYTVGVFFVTSAAFFFLLVSSGLCFCMDYLKTCQSNFNMLMHRHGTLDYGVLSCAFALFITGDVFTLLIVLLFVCGFLFFILPFCLGPLVSFHFRTLYPILPVVGRNTHASFWHTPRSWPPHSHPNLLAVLSGTTGMFVSIACGKRFLGEFR